MKVYVFLFAVLLSMLFVACDKEDSLSPSENGKWVLSIPDKSGRFNELAYKIFKDTGVALFVNDTLGSEERGIGPDGSPIIHYEVITIGYTINAIYGTAGYALSDDTLAMVKAAELIRDKVLPRILPGQEPYCFLLVDTLYSSYRGWSKTDGFTPYGTQNGTYKDMMALIVGQLCDILNMSEQEQAYWAGRILAANIASQIQARYGEELKEFYNVSLKSGTSTWHNAMMYAYLDGTPITVGYDKDFRENGFLEWILDGQYLPRMPERLIRSYPNKEIDAEDYIAAVYAYEESEFEEEYANYPLCIEKFKMMKKIVSDYEAQVKKY